MNVFHPSFVHTGVCNASFETIKEPNIASKKTSGRNTTNFAVKLNQLLQYNSASNAATNWKIN
jgi:hypothetical protein